jgi:hypothetical protein
MLVIGEAQALALRAKPVPPGIPGADFDTDLGGSGSIRVSPTTKQLDCVTGIPPAKHIQYPS